MELTKLCSYCKHPLGDHYVSYNGKIDGCAHVTTYDDQRDGYSQTLCKSCPGFQITYRAVGTPSANIDFWNDR